MSKVYNHGACSCGFHAAVQYRNITLVQLFQALVGFCLADCFFFLLVLFDIKFTTTLTPPPKYLVRLVEYCSVLIHDSKFSVLPLLRMDGGIQLYGIPA